MFERFPDPWSMGTSALTVGLMTAATLIAAPRIASAACTIPGFDRAAFGDDHVNIQNGNTDSYNSATGGYSTTQCNAAGMGPCVGGVGTNGTSNGAISVNSPNGSVQGQCQIGPGAPTTFINGGSTQCSSTSTSTGSLGLNSVTAPVYANGSVGACTGSPTACNISNAASPAA